MDDVQLLKQYVKDGSQEAFAGIVRRHVDLVYGMARRLVGDEHLAEDVAQAAFLVLAQKAKQVEPRRLAGWLVNATRLAANEARRSKLCREKHEWRAAQMRSSKGSEEGDEPTLAELTPLLDEALCRLGEADRTAVAMRFLEGRSFAEVSAVMGISEEAARKRVERAVEKLRRVFMKRGFAPSVGGLMVVLAAHQAQAAPAGLAGSISAIAISGGAGTGAILAKGAMTMMTMAKVKVAAVILMAVGVGAGAVALSQVAPGAARPAAGADAAAATSPPAAVSAESANSVQPLKDWEKPVWNGRTRLSAAELPVAKRIIDRYAANFAKITSVSLHEERKMTALSDDRVAKEFLDIWRDVFPIDIDVTVQRDPLHFHMTGARGGKPVDFVITPAGVIGNSPIGVARSVPPDYLDGDQSVDEPLLEAATNVAEDTSIETLDPRAGKHLLQGSQSKDSHYDIIKTASRNPGADGRVEGMTKSHWFNRTTGMLDFVIVNYQNDSNSRPLASLQSIEYQKVNGIYYPSHSLSVTLDGKVQMTRDISGLKLNDGTASTGNK